MSKMTKESAKHSYNCKKELKKFCICLHHLLILLCSKFIPNYFETLHDELTDLLNNINFYNSLSIMRLKHALRTVWLLALLVIATAMSAQTRVTGTVYEPDGKTPMIGATVMEKGTKNGTSTDVDGHFSLKVTGKSPVLVINSVGYKRQEVKPTGGTVTVRLEESSTMLNDVVVTALGITREQKSLGYAVSKVDNSELTKTQSGNWLNSLNGKVAGLSMTGASSGPTSTMRVVLRGDQSLNYGANEALFVVDGVPITSEGTSSGSGSSYSNNDAPVDFGNAASDINPEDIESVSVLKGPAATALYGSRAANGAIIITTKSGRSKKGVGVTINSSVVFEKAGYFPDFQSTYGPGSDLGYTPFSMWSVDADHASDGIAQSRHYSRYGFGEKYDANQMRYLYQSYDWDTGMYTKMPWVYQKDWYTGIFETGTTWNNTVTVDGSNGKGSNARLSITDTHNDWILPNTGYQKQTVNFSGTTQLNKWIKLNAKATYTRKQSDNMPVMGYGAYNPLYLLAWGFSCNPMQVYRDEYFKGRYTPANVEAGMIVNPASYYNPYRSLYEELNANEKNRIYGNVSVNINLPVKGLTLDLRTGLDMDDEFRQLQRPYYSPGHNKGYYREQTIRDYEYNHDFLLRYVNNSWVNKRLGFNVAFGGNAMTRKWYRSYITLDELGEEGVYNANNTPIGINPTPYNYHAKKIVNSFYGFASLSWDDTYYLDITGRNDWSSALGRGNWSYFYPSVSASILLDKALKLKNKAWWVDMLKMRLSWANVGNDTSPYTLTDTYSRSATYPGGYSLPGSMANPLIKPENVESWELGLEAMLFKNRLGLDLAFYSSSTTDQIISAATDPIIGASSRLVNAGKIRNRGIEISTHIVPVRARNVEWSMDINWSRNWNKLVEYSDGWDPATPLQLAANGTTIGNRVYIYSFVGHEMNVIYGKGYQRAPEGATYTDAEGNTHDCSGAILVNPKNGYPLLDTKADRRIGRVNPMWRGGMTQTVKFFDFTFSATFSAQYGGHAFSVTNFALGYQGKLKSTLPGRQDGLVVDGVNAIAGADGKVTYTKNTTVTENISTYYNSYKYVRDNTEENTFSTNFFKCKEVRLDYALPKKICAKTRVLQGASLGFYMTNLFCITHWPQYDPEVGSLNGAYVTSGIEAMSFPMTRSYGVNVKLSF